MRLHLVHPSGLSRPHTGAVIERVSRHRVCARNPSILMWVCPPKYGAANTTSPPHPPSSAGRLLIIIIIRDAASLSLAAGPVTRPILRGGDSSLKQASRHQHTHILLLVRTQVHTHKHGVETVMIPLLLPRHGAPGDACAVRLIYLGQAGLVYLVSRREPVEVLAYIASGCCLPASRTG